MDMNTALVPYLLSPAGGTGGVAQTDGNSRPAATGLETAGKNIAFYFRNWPFPVDMVEPGAAEAGHRSWHERLASYRAASQAAARPRADEGADLPGSEDQALRMTPAGDDRGQTVPRQPNAAYAAQDAQVPGAPKDSAADEGGRRDRAG